MFIYVGKNFTSTVTGTRILDVCCEQCKTNFKYELVRQGSGAGSAPYYIGQKFAQARAEKAAQKQLKKRLDTEREMVPCPKCHWINNDAIVGYRSSRYRGLGSWGIGLGVILFFVLLLVLMIGDGNHESSRYSIGPALIIAAAAGLLLMTPFLILQKVLRKRINPNSKFPQPPIIPPGTPRGWTAEEMAKPFIRDDRFVPGEEAATPYPDWAIFRAGYLILPQVCCECLAPATTTYKTPFKVNDQSNTLPVPLCKECHSRLRGSWWLVALGCFVAAGFAGGIAYYLVRADQVGKMIIAGLILVFGGLFAMAIVPNLLVSPYLLKTVDRSRAIFRIKFRNEQFTEMVRKNSRDMENMRFQPQRVMPVPPS